MNWFYEIFMRKFPLHYLLNLLKKHTILIMITLFKSVWNKLP